MDRKKNRSDRYQPLFAELPYSNDMMADFSERYGLYDNYKPEDRERLMDLREDLKKEFWRLVDTELTERQREVLHLYAQGFTQIEIAKKLKVNQSSITKSINGNCDYRKQKVVYGGTKKKIRKLSETDPKIQEIMREIAEIHSEYQ
jgi:DNA-binding CsgD family transcriptional regulator